MLHFQCDQNCWVIDDFFAAHDENALLWLKTCTWVIFYWAPKLPDQPVLSLRPLVGDSILFAIDYHNKYSFIKSQKKNIIYIWLYEDYDVHTYWIQQIQRISVLCIA